MIRPRSVTALIGGGALIVAVNALILGGAASNRRGEPPVVLTLTERELSLPQFREDEGSGIFLTFNVAGESPAAVQRAARMRRSTLEPVTYPWLDETKLRALGVRLDEPAGGDGHDHGPVGARARHVFVALELDGDAWQRLVASREERVARVRKELEAGTGDAQALTDAETLLALDRAMRSRLVPIDADRDGEALRRRSAGRPGVVVLEAVVDAVREPAGTDGAHWRGRIPYVVVADVRVPSELRGALAPYLPKETPSEQARRELALPVGAWPAAAPPRYRAVVAFGRRNEPWLVSVAPAD